MGSEDRPDLSGGPRGNVTDGVQPATRAEGPSAEPKTTQNRPASTNNSGFDFNRPTIISLLYAGGYVTGITAIIGVVLGYVWKGETHEPWETSHYQYLIRTFWIGLIGSVAGVILSVILIGILILLAVAVQVVVRIVLSMIAAQKREPMPNPDSWLI